MPKHRYGYAQMGVNYAAPPYELNDAELADARNVYLTDAGLLTGRGGSTKLNSTAVSSRITSVHEYHSGTSRATIATHGTKVSVYSSATGELMEQITGLADGELWQWVNFAGKAIGVNEGTDYPQYYADTGSGKLTTDANLPKAKCVIEWSNRIYFWGNSTDVARLSGCAALDPTDFTTTGAAGRVWQTVGDSKDPATGGIGFYDMMLLGKRNQIYKMYSTTGIPTDAESIAIKPLFSKSSDQSNAGFTSKWAITQIGNDILFLDGFDIKRLSAVQEYGDVETSSVIPHFREYLSSICDKSMLQYTQFFHYKKRSQVWVAMPISAAENYVFVLDYRFAKETGRMSVFPMSAIDAVVFGGVESGTLANIYFGDNSGFVNWLDTTSDDDNGSAIDRYAVTVAAGNNPRYGVVDRHDKRKHFVNTEAFIAPTESTLTMTPYYGVDLLDNAAVRDSGNYTAMDAETVTGWESTGTKHKRVPFYGVSGNTLALKWRHYTVAENFILHPSSITYNWKSGNLIV